MPPLTSYRRARRRSRRQLLIIAACALVVLALLIGGVTKIGHESGPYDASVNQSFATQGALVVQQSNATGATLRNLMANMQKQDRQTLQAQLDTVTAQADQEAAAAENLATPATSGGVQGAFATVFTQRDQATRALRSAYDGLLGLRPLPVAGAPGAQAALVATPTLLSLPAATDRVAAAGTVLAGADRSYRSLRRALPGLPGHARLPASRWITDATVWQPGSLTTQVQLVNASSSLQMTHRLYLRVVKVSPPALPSPTGVATPGQSVLSPTTGVVVQVVLSNAGSVDEPRASVQFQLTSQVTGTAVRITRTAGLAAGRSVSLSPVSFTVKPGTSYQLTVAVVLPQGQADSSGTALNEVLHIAPGT
jgi:hypothetical protein